MEYNRGEVEMSEPSPEAKQAWRKYQDRVNSDPKNYQVGDHEEGYYCLGYDAATVKLREALEHIRIAAAGHFEKDGLNIPIPLARRIYLMSCELARQQPSAPTPDMEKIARELAKDDRLWNTQDMVEASLLKFATQAHAPLVADKERLDWLEGAVQWNDPTNTAKIVFTIPTVPHIRLRDAIDAALTDTKET